MLKEDKIIKLIAKLIIERLSNMDKWGGAHSEFRRVVKSLPNHIKGSSKGKKQIKKAIKLLVDLGFLLTKPSTGEFHVSLNPRMKSEIDEFIEKNEKEDYKL